jgi:hypothetical protein
MNNFLKYLMLLLFLFLYNCNKKSKLESYFLCNKHDRICIRTFDKDSTKLTKIEAVFLKNKIKFLDTIENYTEFYNSYDISFYLKTSDYLVIDNEDRGQKVLNEIEKRYLDGLIIDLKKSIKNIENDTIYLDRFRLPIKFNIKKNMGSPPPSLKDIYFDYYYNDLNDNFDD